MPSGHAGTGAGEGPQPPEGRVPSRRRQGLSPELAGWSPRASRRGPTHDHDAPPEGAVLAAHGGAGGAGEEARQAGRVGGQSGLSDGVPAGVGGPGEGAAPAGSEGVGPGYGLGGGGQMVAWVTPVRRARVEAPGAWVTPVRRARVEEPATLGEVLSSPVMSLGGSPGPRSPGGGEPTAQAPGVGWTEVTPRRPGTRRVGGREGGQVGGAAGSRARAPGVQGVRSPRGGNLWQVLVGMSEEAADEDDDDESGEAQQDGHAAGRAGLSRGEVDVGGAGEPGDGVACDVRGGEGPDGGLGVRTQMVAWAAPVRAEGRGADSLGLGSGGLVDTVQSGALVGVDGRVTVVGIEGRGGRGVDHRGEQGVGAVGATPVDTMTVDTATCAEIERHEELPGESECVECAEDERHEAPQSTALGRVWGVARMAAGRAAQAGHAAARAVIASRPLPAGGAPEPGATGRPADFPGWTEIMRSIPRGRSVRMAEPGRGVARVVERGRGEPLATPGGAGGGDRRDGAGAEEAPVGRGRPDGGTSAGTPAATGPAAAHGGGQSTRQTPRVARSQPLLCPVPECRERVATSGLVAHARARARTHGGWQHRRWLDEGGGVHHGATRCPRCSQWYQRVERHTTSCTGQAGPSVPPSSAASIQAVLRQQAREAPAGAGAAAPTGGAGRPAPGMPEGFDWLRELMEEEPVFTRRAGIPVPARAEVTRAWVEVAEAVLAARAGTREEEEAWGMFFLFPRLILRPLPTQQPGSRGVSAGTGVMAVRREIERRLRHMREGRMSVLLEEARADAQVRQARRRRDRDRTRAQRAYTDTEVPPEEEAAARVSRAARLASVGEHRRASQALLAGGLAPGGPDTVRRLQDKHPPRREPAGERRGGHPVVRMQMEHLQAALGSGMPRHSGTGVDGWRFEHFRDLCGGDQRARTLVLQILQRIGDARVPPRVGRFLRVTVLMAFPKEGGDDVRPIGIASVVRRLLGRVVMEGVREEFARAVAPFQFACGVRGGTDMLCHTMRVLLDMHPDWVWFAWDLANAFNTVSREAVLRALEAEEGLRHLVPLFCLLHDQDGECLYRDEDGVHVIWSCDGVVQGDPLSMALFCLAVAGVLRRLAAIEPAGSVVVAFADDGRVGAPLAVLRRILDAAESEFRGVGLSLQMRKLKVWVPRGGEEALREARIAFPGVAEVTSDGMRTVGVPLGVPEYAERALTDVVQGHGILMERIQEMARDHGHRFQAWRMSQICGARRFQYHIRVAAPQHSRGPARAGGVLCLRTAEVIIHAHAGGVGREETPEWGDRLELPQAHGGGGFTDMEAEAPLSHLSSWGATLRPMIDRFEGADGGHVHPALQQVASELRRAAVSTLPWAVELRRTHAEVEEQMQWSDEDRAHWVSFFCMAPTQPGVEVAGQRRPARRETAGEDEEDEFRVPDLAELVQETHHGMQHELSRALARRRTVQAWRRRGPVERARMLSSGGMGGGAFLVAAGAGIPDELFPIAARHYFGCPEPLADGLTACPECGVHMASVQVRDHVARCPYMRRGGGRDGGQGTAGLLYHYHRVLVDLVARVLQEAGGTTILEMPGLLAGTFERPADVACISLDGSGQHLIVDVACVHVLASSQIDRGRASTEAGFAARHVESAKRRQYQRRVEQAGHRFVPFVIEDGGRLGQQAAALLGEMATRRAARTARPEDWGMPPAERRRRYLARWLEQFSVCLHAEVATWIQLSLIRARERQQDPFGDCARHDH